MSSAIADLQKSPGRLNQSLEQSSAEVWTNSNSGVGASQATVSYYGKGNVVAFLLDAHIRRLTNGSKSLDDGMRLAYTRYGGARGFTATELRATFEEVAGANLKPWFVKAIGTAGELDYGEMLAWYGLRFAGGPGTAADGSWMLEVRPRATAAQRKHLAALVSSPRPVTLADRVRRTCVPNRRPEPHFLHPIRVRSAESAGVRRGRLLAFADGHGRQQETPRLLYNVHSVKRYTVAQVRERLASALDEVERGVPVVIERRGVRYVISLQARKARAARRPSVIETLDPAIAAGQWTWTWTARGLRLKRPRRG